MAEPDLSALQTLVQRVLEQTDLMLQKAASKDAVALLRDDLVLLRGQVERGLDAVSQRLDGQMLRNQRQDERLDGIGEQVKRSTRGSITWRATSRPITSGCPGWSTRSFAPRFVRRARRPSCGRWRLASLGAAWGEVLAQQGAG
jgi:hypothetical protein